MSCTCHWCSTSWNGTSSCSSNSTTFVTGRSRIVQTSFGYQFSRFQCPESSEIFYLHLKFLTFSRWCYFLVQRLYLGNHSCKSSSTFLLFLYLHIYYVLKNDVLLCSHFLLEEQLSGYMKLHLVFQLLWVRQHTVQV